MIEDSKLRKVGRIHNKILNDIKRLVKPEVSYIELFEYVETKIRDNGFKPAFPINISVNEIAAHDTPRINDNRVIHDGDVVKIDIGIHYDGWITDGAITIEVNDSKYKELISASEKALKNAIKIIKKNKEDTKLSDIGKTIERTIKSFGLHPIYNLTGHKIDKYILHSGLSIPNFDNGSQKTIGFGVFAIEPFSTNGKGYVKETEPSTIYHLNTDKIRLIRMPTIKRIVDKIYNEFKTLPFSKLQLYNILSNKQSIDFVVNTLKHYGVLYEYPVLKEVSKGMVAQAETTVLIYNGVEDLIRIYVVDD